MKPVRSSTAFALSAALAIMAPVSAAADFITFQTGGNATAVSIQTSS